jgi:hypothetical protein
MSSCSVTNAVPVAGEAFAGFSPPPVMVDIKIMFALADANGNAATTMAIPIILAKIFIFPPVN